MNPSWNSPPAHLCLSSKGVHIWQAALDLPAKSVQDLNASLSIDEKMKADHFRFDRDRRRFIVARGILRLILACYLSVAPDAVRFCYEKNGKPRLDEEFSSKSIQFNLSHSEGLALYVFARGHEVGVDVEYMRGISETEQIIEQFFSARERVVYSALPTSEKQETFYKWWTRREAFVKAVGEGLSHPLDMFDALLFDGKSAEPSGILRGAKEQPRWSVWDVRPAEEFAGAVVVEGGDWVAQCWQWPGTSMDCLEGMRSKVHSFSVSV